MAQSRKVPIFHGNFPGRDEPTALKADPIMAMGTDYGWRFWDTESESIPLNVH